MVRIIIINSSKRVALTISLMRFFRDYTGDLFVVLHVNEKRGIWKEGLHLYSKINIDFTEAILGSVKKVLFNPKNGND